MSKEITIQQASRDKRATMDSFKVKRDGEGKLIPIDCESPYGIIGVLPMTYGDSEVWSKTMSTPEDVTSDQLATQFRKHIVEPDMSKVTGDMLKQDFLPLVVQELIMAIVKVSGLEKEIEATVNDDGTAKIEVAKN